MQNRTFISRARLLKDVSSLRENVDVVHGLTLLLPSPQQAKEWLRRHNWTDANFLIPSVSVLLEDGSFALRPVFLKLLAEQIKPKDIKGDCRQADLSSLVFKDSNITSLIADDASRFPSSIPVPVVLITENGLQVTDADKITQWLDERGRSTKPTTSPVVPDKVKTHRIYALLGRACRMRQYWLRAGDDDVHAERILNDDYWPVLSRVLDENGFLRIEKRDASGGSSPFYHIKQSQRILSERSSDTEVVKFFSDLSTAI